MPVYEWRCRTCGYIKESLINAGGPCPQCKDTLRRKFSFSTTPPSRAFQPHFNYSVGKWVTSMQDFRDTLRAKSDAQSERLGIEHNYQPIDPMEKSALGVTDEHMYEIDRAHAQLKSK